MHLFLTSVLPFLAHDHPSAVAFLTCRYHNFHSSIIPEFLSDEERVRKFCCARQQKNFEREEQTPYEEVYTKLNNLFVRTPLMQFSPSLSLCQKDCTSILKPLLETKYFTRTLQRCSLITYDLTKLEYDVLQSLSKIQSLTNLHLGWCKVENQHLEIIIHSFPSLETLVIQDSRQLEFVTPSKPAIKKILRNLTLRNVGASFVTQFVPHFPNLKKLDLCGECKELNLLPLSSSLLLLNDMSLTFFTLENAESLKNLAHLSSLQFIRCRMPGSLSFLSNNNSLPHLNTLCLDSCSGLDNKESFASLAHVPNLHVLKLNSSKFDNDCFQYLEIMVYLRKLDLEFTSIVGDSRSLKSLMQNLCQLEELNLWGCRVGSGGAVAGALYSTHSRLRVLNLRDCNLSDDDLNGIGVLRNTLEVLDLARNDSLTNDGLVYCKDLVNLKILKLSFNYRIRDLSPLEGCLSLQELDVIGCHKLKKLSKLKSWRLRCCLGIEDQ